MKRHTRLPLEAGTARYIRVVDARTGATGYLRAEPAIVPTSQARFARSRPLPTSTQPLPLYAAEARA